MKLTIDGLKQMAVELMGHPCFVPCPKAWGAVIDLISVNEGQLAGFLIVDDDLIAKSADEWLNQIAERMSITWAVTTPEHVYQLIARCPPHVGVLMVNSWDDVCTVRCASIKAPPIEHWIKPMDLIERVMLAPDLGFGASEESIAKAGIKNEGAFLFRDHVTRVLAKRCVTPSSPARSEVDPLDVLKAVQSRLDNFRPIRL